MKLSTTLIISLIPSLSLAELSKTWTFETVSSRPNYSVAGDVDGDGDLDAFLDSTLLLNDGTGLLSPAAPIEGLNNGDYGLLYDFDGDDNLDLVPGIGQFTNKVFFNDGDGNFTAGEQEFPWDGSSDQGTVGDVDGDDDLDIIIAVDSGARPNLLLINDGSGGFSLSANDVGSGSRSAELGDVDGDDDLDLVVGRNGINYLYLNDGTGVFTQSAQDIGGQSTYDIELADLDGDDDLDLYICNGSNSASSSTDEIYFNDGDGVFTESTQTLTSDYSFGVTLADADGDDDIDAFLSSNSGIPNKLYLNDGDGVFSLHPDFNFGLGFARHSAIGDFNGDMRPDILPSASSGIVRLFLGTEGPDDLSFSPTSQFLGHIDAQAGAPGDFDGDNDIDIILGGASGELRMMTNDGNGSFTDTGSIAVPGNGASVAALSAADIDGDDDLDLFLAFDRRAPGAAIEPLQYLLLNDGNGAFTLSSQTFSSEPAQDVAIADMNGDEVPDIIIAASSISSPSAVNQIWFNNDDDSFTPGSAFDSGVVADLAVGDFDGDLDLDVALGFSNKMDTLWLNDGDGVLTDSGTTFGNDSSTDLRAFHANDDLHLDLFVGGRSGANTSKVLLNDGTGTFTLGADRLGPNSSSEGVPFDADDDGDLDVWIDYDQIMLNEGDATFPSRLFLSSDRQSNNAFVADFNGDGRMDLFVASDQGTHYLFSDPRISVTRYAESFGLTGDDTTELADPDDDGLSNIEEMAYNLDPSTPDAIPLTPGGSEVRGTPIIRVELREGSPVIIAETIEHRLTEVYDYQLLTSTSLEEFTEPLSVTRTETPIDATYQRVILETTPPDGTTKLFGQFALRLIAE